MFCGSDWNISSTKRETQPNCTFPSGKGRIWSLTGRPPSLLLLISFPPHQHHQRLHCIFPHTYLLIRDTWLWKTWQSFSPVGATAALQPPFLSSPALWSRLSQTCPPHPPPHYEGDSTAAVMKLWWLHLNWLTRFSCSFSPGQPPPFSALPGHIKAIEILSLGPVFRAIGAFFCHPEWIRGKKNTSDVSQ